MIDPALAGWNGCASRLCRQADPCHPMCCSCEGSIVSLLCALVLAVLMPAATDQRINLADFARVVKFVSDTPARLEVQELETGPDGWPVWTGEGGQSMIGIEWDEPRDIAEAEIEFRHAIA